MAADEDDKERLSNSEFSELVPHLPLQDLLKIEYRVNKWSPLFTIVNATSKSYRCDVCGVVQCGMKNLISHIDGKKHKIKAQTIKQLFHPSYTYAKEQVGMAMGAARQKERSASKVAAVNVPGTLIASTTKALNSITPVSAKTAVTSKLIPVIADHSKIDIKVGSTNKSIIAKSSTLVKSNTVPNTSSTVQKSLMQVNKPLSNISNDTVGAVSTIAAKILRTVSDVTSITNLNKFDSSATPIKQQSGNGLPITYTPIKKSEANRKMAITPKPEQKTDTLVKSCTEENSAFKSKSNAVMCQPKSTNTVQKKFVNIEAVNTYENISSPKSKTNVVSKAETASILSTQSDTLKNIQIGAPGEIREDNIQDLNSPESNNAPNTPLIHKSGKSCDRLGAASSLNKQIKKEAEKFTSKILLEASVRHAVEKENQQDLKDLDTSVGESEAETKTVALSEQDDVNHVNDQIEKFVKNPFAALRAHEIAENITEVIVIEDDKSVDLEEDAAIDSNIIKESTKRGQEQDTTKDSTAEEGSLPKRKKIVVNPAAAIKEKFAASDVNKAVVDENIANAPKYQSDIVIIPTIHKNKIISTVTSRIERQPQFSTKTFSSKPSDDGVHGLVGVEYVVKILKNSRDLSPKYECGLCELVLDGSTMQNHLTGYNHRLKFSEKHFPTAIRQYRQFMGNLPQHEVYKVMAPILSKLALAIEQHHGRDLPYECLEREFNVNRHDILSKVFSCRHASEQYGPTFTHVVDSKEIDQLIAQRHNYKPHTSREATFDTRLGSRPHQGKTSSSVRRDYQQYPWLSHDSRSLMPQFGVYQPFISQPQLVAPYHSVCNEAYSAVDDETHKLMVEHFLKDTVRSSHRSHSHTVNKLRQRKLDPHFNRSRSRSRSRSNSRYERGIRKSISPLRENDIWQAYRHMVDQKLNELEELFKLYRKDPECHPMYNEEWQKFWRRRKDELIAVGLDHRTYNYQPEWVRFFEVRVEELYAQEMENTKIQCRERLCLPMTNDELFDPKYHVQKKHSNNATLKPSLRLREFKSAVELKGKETNQEDDKSSRVISVLRLMTALEEYLGSLGPKIIDLLAKALQTEKTNPEQINSIILTAESSTLLETAMEKFKGLVIAGLLENSKERALRKAIREVESLLQLAVKERRNNPCHSKETTILINAPRSGLSPVRTMTKQLQNPPVGHLVMPLITAKDRVHNQHQHTAITSISNPAVNLLAQVDKKELATKLAAALAAQGKTDFDPEQLQQLIAVYTIIEKKKREAAALSKPDVSTSSSTNVINKRSLSDTLADFVIPCQRQKVDDALLNDRQTYTAQSISNYVNMMRRTSGMLPSSAAGNNVQENVYYNKQGQQNIPNYIPLEGNKILLDQNEGIRVDTARNTLNWVDYAQNLRSNNSNMSEVNMPTKYQSNNMNMNNFETNSSSTRTMNASGSNFYNANKNGSARMNNNNINVALNNQQRLRQENSSPYNRYQNPGPNLNHGRNQNWMPIGRGPNRNGSIESNSNILGNTNASSFSLWRKN